MRKMRRIVLSWVLTVLLAVSMLGNIKVKATEQNLEYPEIIPGNLTNYYGYDVLGTMENGEEMQALYKELEEVAWAFYISDEPAKKMTDNYPEGADSFVCGEVDTSDVNLSYNEILLVTHYFASDNPIYYYCASAYGELIQIDGDKVVIYASHYFDEEKKEYLEFFADNQAYYRDIIENKLHEYYDCVRELETDYDKERAIYEKLANEVTYNEKDVTTPTAHNIIGPFKDSITVCEGYSKAFALICNYCGIDSIYIEGDAGGPHAWNYVCLDGEWFGCDVTWDGATELEEGVSCRDRGEYALENACIGTQMNVPREQFLSSHAPEEKLNSTDILISYPQLSNSSRYWTAYNSGIFINDLEGLTDSERIERCKNYVISEIKKGKTYIDFLYYGLDYNYFPIVYQATSRAFDEYKNDTGEQYDYMFGSSGWGSYSLNGATIGEEEKIIMICRIGISRVEETDSYTYKEFNNVGGGIQLTKYVSDEERVVIPVSIDGKNISSIFLSGEYNQCVLPEGIYCIDELNANQVIVPDGIRDLRDNAYISNNYNGLFVPSSVKFMSEVGMYNDDGNLAIKPGYKIYGYTDSYAERYANKNGITFIDVTGKELIDNITINGITNKTKCEDIQLENAMITDISISDYSQSEADYVTSDCLVEITVKAKDGYAITPNTLVDINESVACIKNVDINEAIVSCVFSKKDIFKNVIKEIQFPEGNPILHLGDEKQLVVVIIPEDADKKELEWFSDDETIVSVDSNGKVKANGVGYTIITAVAKDGSGVSMTCEVTVVPKNVPPTTEAPTTEEPTTEAPTTEEPTTEAPTTEAPTTEAPTTEEPTTEAPTTEEPTTEAPTTEAPTTEAPTTEEPVTPPVEKPTPKVDVTYHTHIQTLGDTQGTKKNGEMAGTSGMAKRLENIWIDVEGNDNLGIQYTTHCQTYGWMPWSCDGESNGTSGEAKRLEAIMIQLTGADKDKYDVYYRVHAQSYGWLGWAKNGEPSGTAGYGKRLEGIQVVVVKKGEAAPGLKYAGVDGSSSKYGKQPYVAKTNGAITIPGNTDAPNVMYKTHVQTFGWQKWVTNGQMSGTSGKAKRLEGINIKLSNAPYDGDIVYTTHVQKYGWKDGKPSDTTRKTWKKNGAMSGTNGEAKRLEAICIDLTGEMAEHYDVYYRVHAQTFGWLGWAKNGEESGTAGYAKRLEGIQIVLVEKGGKAPADNYGGITSKDVRPFVEKK